MNCQTDTEPSDAALTPQDAPAYAKLRVERMNERMMGTRAKRAKEAKEAEEKS